MTLTAVVIVTTALFFSGCASTRKSVIRETVTRHVASRFDMDSMANVVETCRTPVKVPMSKVSLTLNVDSLRLLPPGAGYTARQGQAHVNVTRRARTAKEPEQLVIESGCDSLELVCAIYSKTIRTLKRQLQAVSSFSSEQTEATKERSAYGVKIMFFTFLAGLVAGIVFILILRKYGKKCFRRN